MNLKDNGMTFKENVIWIWQYYKKYKPYLLLLFLLTVFSTIVAIAYPMFFKHIIDTLQNDFSSLSQREAKRKLIELALIVFFIGVLRSLTNLYPISRAIMNLKFEIDIREKYFKKILYKNYNFFLKYKTGDLVTRLTEDITTWPAISWFMCSGIFRAVSSFSNFIFCVAVMFYMNARLTLLSVVPLPFMLYIFFSLEDKINKAWKKNKEEK